MNIRRKALHVLHRIISDSIKAGQALDECHVEPSSRSLLHEMVYGVLRRWYSLEADMSRFCRAKPDVRTHLALLLGTYQLRHMRVPAHAAVAETVGAIKAEHPKSAGYVNAVLRQVASHEAPAKLKPHQLAELPKWVYTMWRDAFGADVVMSFARALQHVPALCVAVMSERDAWIDRVRASGMMAEAGELSPYAVLLPPSTDVAALPGFTEGEFTVMDQAAQAAVLALPDVQDGALVLDLCAAPGGKTALLAHRFPRARIVALEMNGRRIPRLMENLARLGCRNVSVIQADAGRLPFADAMIDSVLLDAPCSASGILRRHPDAKFLHDAASIHRLGMQQQALCKESIRVLKPGAGMVYAVCSIHPAENEEVIDLLSSACADVSVGGAERLFPSRTSDGFFFASLKKQQQ
ncbi:MAG TPA: transcription antitermination factor NusB [Mariprofundaceae bacterium]|nr:transcription antitermination factor NusB [Mariprofundaceae bacterium]